MGPPLRARIVILTLCILGLVPTNPLAGQDGTGLSSRESCSQRIITGIRVENRNVFEFGPSDPPFVRWGLGLANRARIRTSESFIRKELLFAEGDCLDPLLLSESRRHLERHNFIRSAALDIQDDGEQGAVVHVRTRDEWSTQVDVGVSYDQGFNLERLSLTETNFAGRGVRVDLMRSEFRERLERWAHLSTPRLFGRLHADVRGGSLRAGDYFSQGFAYPFVGEVGRFSFQQGSDWSQDFATYIVGDGGPYAYLRIPVRTRAFHLSAARRFGDPGDGMVVRVLLSRRSQVRAGGPGWVEGGDFDADVPAHGAIPVSVDRQVSDWAMTAASLHMGRFRHHYREYEGMDANREIQTLQLGYSAGLTVGKGLDVLIPGGLAPTTDSYGRVDAHMATLRGSTFLYASLMGQVGHSPSGWRDAVAVSELVVYARAGRLPSHTLFFRASGAGGARNHRQHQITLGGRDGIRSLSDRHAPGAGRVVFLLEDRIRFDWPEWNALDLGATIFADLGRGWAGDAPFGVDSHWKGSVGLGLRVGAPKGTRNIWRVDLALPLGHSGSPVARVTYEMSKYRFRYGVGQLVRAAQYGG